jgi:hypothetical protein
LVWLLGLGSHPRIRPEPQKKDVEFDAGQLRTILAPFAKLFNL